MAGLEMTDATRLVTVWFAYQGDVIKRHSAARSPLGRASDTCHVFQYASRQCRARVSCRFFRTFDQATASVCGIAKWPKANHECTPTQTDSVHLLHARSGG